MVLNFQKKTPSKDDRASSSSTLDNLQAKYIVDLLLSCAPGVRCFVLFSDFTFSHSHSRFPLHRPLPHCFSPQAARLRGPLR